MIVYVRLRVGTCHRGATTLDSSHHHHHQVNDRAEELTPELEQLQFLKEAIAKLRSEEAALDKLMEKAQNMLKQMAEDDACKRYHPLFPILMNRLAYLNHADVRGIACFAEDTLLAVKAPYGSTLEVPDPDEV
jgi:hypothetical protein